MNFEIDLYDPCPCGSGEKYQFCCAARNKANRHGRYPIGTVALYGPDDTTTTKIVAGVLLKDDAEPIIERWVEADILQDKKIAGEVRKFLAGYGVKEVVVTAGNLGCPHEEGKDFPVGQDCPFCPYWAGKQGTAAIDFDDEDLEDDEDDENDEDFEDDDDDLLDIEQVQDFMKAMSESIALSEQQRKERLWAILGDPQAGALTDRLLRYFAYLVANLKLPCLVSARMEFEWEEPYVEGEKDEVKYHELLQTQPSCDDTFELLTLTDNDRSEWMAEPHDIAAHVRRRSDGKRFILGLSQLETVDIESENTQLLDDYFFWLVDVD